MILLMKTLKQTIHSLAIASLACFGLISCDSFLEEYSQDLAKVESWKDLDEVLLGNVYIKPGRIYVENYYLKRDGGGFDLDILHFMSDEINMSDDNFEDIGYYEEMFPFYTWQRDTGIDREKRYVGGDDKYWDQMYERINICNMIIALIDEQPESFPTDAVEKERVKGEALFMRGLYYFMLTNLYAQPYEPAKAATTPGMPLKTTEYVEDKEFERSSLEETYSLILSDLTESEKCLEGKTRKSRYRVDQAGVRILLSRVYLYMQNWEKSIEYAGKVLDKNSSLMSLASKSPRQSSLDMACPEILFTMGDYFVAAAFCDSRYHIPAWYISDDIAGLYSKTDYRKKLYIGESQTQAYSPVFMKVNGQPETWGTYYGAGSVFTIRTAEAYLNIVEASAYKGDYTTAKNYLRNFLATRMSDEPAIPDSGNELIDFIRDERAREFLLEGHRWFDLRRYTVCEPYPWSKEIVHNYAYFADYSVDYTDMYRLEKNDAAYTLPVPRSIKSFQISLDVIGRPARTPFETVR